jgi:peptidoglycan/xylan/chitin deacetylase (PgdA/CDA1 family)
MYHGTPQRVARDLERQLRYVAGWRDLVALAELAADPERPGKRGRKRAALTFDDGLRSNVTVAYPIGLHATFFVCPGLIGRGEWLWNHEARQRLLGLSPAERAELADHVGAPREVEGFIEWLKKLPLAERRAAESEIRAATPRFRPTDAQREEFDLAGWRELESLDPAVVTLGSHTLTHPILTSLGPAETESEIRDSRQAIEARTGRAADLFCYPNGDFGAATLEAVRRHYRAAVTVSAQALAQWDAHRIPRVAEPGPGMRGMLRLARKML